MTNAAAITLAHRVSRSEQVMFQELEGEAVLLDLASEAYFGLNQVGGRVWQLIEGAPVLSDVLQTLCREYDAPPSRVEQDLLALMHALSQAGLVRLV